MFSTIKNFIEFAAGIVMLISIKSPIDFWLLAICGSVVLLAGFYRFVESQRIFIGGVEIAASMLLFLQAFRAGHPALSIFFGIALFMISVPSIAGLLMQ